MSLAVLVPTVVSAHPLGNFTLNQYSGLTVRSDGVDVTYVLDMAEIPTAQLLANLGSDESHLLEAGASAGYRRTQCATVASQMALRLDGTAAALTPATSTLTFPVGAAGLHTLRLTCHLSTPNSTPTIGRALHFANNNFDDRVGWREVTAVGTSARVAGSDVPAASVSNELTTYPADLLTSPLDVRSAALTVVAGTGRHGANAAAAPTGVLPRGIDQFTNAFVALVSRQTIDIPFVGIALVLALVLGGLHAFAPGHGKTLMAAYLVGQRGSMRHAAALAASVTVTHTIGVLALGVALSVSTAFAPAQIYPVLGIASGVIMVSIGLTLLSRAWRSRRQDSDTHAHAHGHGHAESHPHAHPHPHPHSNDGAAAPEHGHGGRPHAHAPVGGERPRLRGVLAVGFAGGMVPSPSALVVLIGGIALHRTWFAVLLVVVYGLGMALALTGTGLALRHARTVMDRRLRRRIAPRRGAWLGRLAGALPMVTAAAVILVGLDLTLRGSGAL
ncbi:MAG: nickel transporter [Candidatus Dormibacteraeota bacterium]|nr:nickel transporter [Candidatus Dormibacteraeota bacterium]